YNFILQRLKSQGFSFLGSRAFLASALALFWISACALFWFPLARFSGFLLARFSGTFFYEIIFSDSNMQKTFLHTRFYTDAFQNEARNAKSIRRPLSDLRIFSNIFLHLIGCDVNIIHLSTRTPILLLFPPSFFCFCLQKRRFLHI
ncbi:MAG: hypothetical protein ACLR84_05420, partial [Clostridia bacterium]